ncbi:hypothetical protein [Ruania rhizosphaerae]|uniref:hypothetical protein n=1 Tax=Ruania rhizosphaerae TaxID=1840413 RepID=UPI00135B0742|nr:hypothetical protein [Ruania rhizosphaerae]
MSTNKATELYDLATKRGIEAVIRTDAFGEGDMHICTVYLPSGKRYEVKTLATPRPTRTGQLVTRMTNHAYIRKGAGRRIRWVMVSLVAVEREIQAEANR